MEIIVTNRELIVWRYKEFRVFRKKTRPGQVLKLLFFCPSIYDIKLYGKLSIETKNYGGRYGRRFKGNCRKRGKD